MAGTIFWSIFGTYLIGFFFFTYICMFADPAKSRLAYFFTITLPNKVSTAAVNIFGKTTFRAIEHLVEYFLTLIYIVVVFGTWGVIFIYTYPCIEESERVSSFHKTIGYLVFAASVGSWRYASGVSAGIITAETMERFDNYPYDGILFTENNICPTVGIPKLARSKFDRFSNAHIAKFDHFCGWLHNAIGEENYRWFLLFLLVHAGMSIYGAVIISLLFMEEVENNNLWTVTYFNVSTGEEFGATYYIVFQYLFQRHQLHAGLWILMIVMGFVLSLFLVYHFWLASRGCTTNEAAKWDAIRKWHRKQLRRYEKAVKDGLLIDTEKDDPQQPTVPDGDVTCTGGAVSQTESVKPCTESQCAHPGPMPKNIYNVSFADNWKDVIFPRSLRREAIERHQKMARDRGIPLDDGKTKAS